MRKCSVWGGCRGEERLPGWSWSGSRDLGSPCLGTTGQVWTYGSLSQSCQPPHVPSGQKWLTALLTPRSASAPMTALAQLCAASHLQGNQGVADYLYPPVPPWSPDLVALDGAGGSEEYRGRDAGWCGPCPGPLRCIHRGRDPKTLAPLPTAGLLWTVVVNQMLFMCPHSCG